MGNISFSHILVGILVLCAIVLIYFFVSGKNKAKSNNSVLANNTAADTKVETQRDNEALPDDSLIAVLTAAVMAMQSNPDIKIRVTSFRRIPQSSPIWNTIGRRERMENKL